MKTSSTGVLCALAAAALFMAMPLSAHHDDFWGVLKDPIVLKGKLVRFEFKNPHSFLFVDVKGPEGEVRQWSFQMGPPHLLVQQGWSANSLKAGDEVTLTVFVEKNPNNRGLLKEVEFAGKKLPGQPARP